MLSDHSVTPPVPETTRVLCFITHVQLIKAYDAYIREVGKVPRLEIRGMVEFVEPGKRSGAWRKKREIELSDWYEVRDLRRDEPLLLIWYRLTGGHYRSAPQFTDQWVRPMPLFDHQWFDVRMCPTFANETAASLARQHEHEESASQFPLA